MTVDIFRDRMTDGLSSIQDRIAEIRERIAPVAPTKPASTGTSGGSNGPTVSTRPSFADLLAQATRPATTSPGPTLAQLKSYGNGKLPASALTSIGVGDHKLWGPAADKFAEMRKAAGAVGVDFGVNDSYRSYDEQVQVAKTKGLYSQGGLAAVPGTSDHGLGLSLDLQLDAKAQQWMNKNAGTYGFTNNVRGESWHWTYSAA